MKKDHMKKNMEHVMETALYCFGLRVRGEKGSGTPGVGVVGA